jgi:hypothetical protein
MATDARVRGMERRMVEHHAKPFVCACCGYKAVDVDDLLLHKPMEPVRTALGGEER